MRAMMILFLFGLPLISAFAADEPAPPDMASIAGKVRIAAPDVRAGILNAELQILDKKIKNLEAPGTFVMERANLLVRRQILEPIVKLANSKPTMEDCDKVRHEQEYAGGFLEDQRQMTADETNAYVLINLFCPFQE